MDDQLQSILKEAVVVLFRMLPRRAKENHEKRFRWDIRGAGLDSNLAYFQYESVALPLS
jgi:hypothetical protein